jgi:Putative adhesin
MVDMSKDWPDAPGLSRQQSWPVEGPAELELSVDVGRIRVQLDEQVGDGGAQEVRVEVRHDPSAGGTWSQGLSGLLNWLGGPPDGQGGDLEQLAADAVRAVEISWSETGRRLVVRSTSELPLRVIPLVITVSAPTGSRLAARAGSGDIRVTGTAGWTAVRTGSGDVAVAAVDGEADVTTGSGDVELGPIAGRARVRTGSGTVSVARTGGPTEIKASSGDVTVQEVAADLGVRTGSGEVTIADARSGHLDLTTGSGGLRIGVHPGVRAELDLSSGSGRARSELDVRSVAPEQAPPLQVRGRTGSGDVLVTRAVVAA